jgi:hypothetical protein
MRKSKKGKLISVYFFMGFCWVLGNPAYTQTIPEEIRDELVVHLESLSEGWVETSVARTNDILQIYKMAPQDEWTSFFEKYFEDHYFTDALRLYLTYPTFFWSDCYGCNRMHS